MNPDVRAAARAELWRRGDIHRLKLKGVQKEIWAALEKSGRKFCMLASRRLGKSFVLALYCTSFALKNKNARISFAAPFARDAADIATDLMTEILEDCPEDIRPEYKTATKEYIFPSTGSIIRFAGLNAEHANQLRGRKADVFVIDELALVDDLKHTISDIALPMTLTTGGKLLFATTPARSPGHDSTGIIKKMDADGQVVRFTILDNNRVSDEIKAEYLVEAGEDPARVQDILAGKARPESTTALREYFCEFVTDAETAVLPEFTHQAQSEIVVEHPPPAYMNRFVAMDPGFNDKTGILFSYYDFHAKKLVIQDEMLLSRASTDDIALAIKVREEALWGGARPLLRVSDIDLRLIADLAQAHGIVFSAANRQDALGAVDLVRNMIRRREIIILPACTNLIRQMRQATWNRSGRDFDRTAEDGHYDLVAALKYLCRHVIRTSAFPSWWGQAGYDTVGGFGYQKPKTIFSDTPLGRRLAKKWG